MKKLIVSMVLVLACALCGQAYAATPVVQKSISSVSKANKISKPKHVAKKPIHKKYSAGQVAPSKQIVKAPAQK